MNNKVVSDLLQKGPSNYSIWHMKICMYASMKRFIESDVACTNGELLWKESINVQVNHIHCMDKKGYFIKVCQTY